MSLQRRVLMIAAMLALGVMTATAASAQSAAKPASTRSKKPAAVKPAATHVFSGTIVTVTDDTLTARSGKKDMIFKIDSATQKPSSMAAGNEVTINYHDAAKQHLATNIQPAAAKPKGLAAKAPASK